MGVLLSASRTEGGGWAAQWERNRGLGWVCWGQGWQGVEDTERLGEMVLSGPRSKSFLVTLNTADGEPGCHGP